MSISNFRKLTILAAAAVASAPAAATVITSTSDDFTVNWSRDIGGGITVLASAFFDVIAVSDTQLDLTITATNLADPGAPDNWKGGWTSLGWSVAPNATSYGFLTPGVQFDGITAGSIPSLGAVELCVWSGNNCNGGGQGSLLADGATDKFTVRLISAADGLNTWTLENFGVKFQTAKGSYEFYGTTEVPEPITLGLLGMGLLGVGFARRRK